MSTLVQQQAPKATTAATDGALSLGRTDDVAEARVERDVAKNPTLKKLHGDRVSEKRRSPRRAPTQTLPAGISTATAGSGAALPGPLNRAMGSAFKTDFSHVKVHADATADRAAKQMGAAAFAVNDHIGFAGGLYQPETPAGRGLIAHELAHVAEQASGQDRPGVVRRNIFEDIADFFGGAGSSFSDREVSDYLQVLRQTNEIEDNIDSDNKARFIVNTILYPGSGTDATSRSQQALQNESIGQVLERADIRGLLVKEMATGIVADQDESAIMKVLDRANDFDREIIIGVAGAERLLDKIDDEDRRRRLDGYILARNNAAFRPVPVSFELYHEIQGAEETSDSERGLFVKEFKVKPAGQDDFSTLTRDVSVTGRSGQDFPLAQDFPHARNQSGEALIDFQVGRTEGPRVVLRRDEITRMSDTTSGSYPAIPVAERPTVEAHLNVELENREVPATSVTRSQTHEITDVRSVRRERRREVTDTAGVTAGSSRSRTSARGGRDTRGATARHQEGRSAEVESEHQQGAEVGASSSHTEGEQQTDETEDTSTFTGSVTFSGQLSGTLTNELKLALAAELGLDLGNLLGSSTVLSRLSNGLIGRILRLAGRAGGALTAVLSLIDKANLTLGIDASGQFSITGTISGEAALEYQRAHRRLSRTTTEDSTETGVDARVRRQDTDRAAQGASSEDELSLNRQFESNFEDSLTEAQSLERTIQQQITEGESTAVETSRTNRASFTVSATTPDRRLVTVVTGATLTFNIEGQPRAEQE